MPGIALHLLCASQVLRRWIHTPPAAPLDVHDPTVVDAFFQGCIGPDMGYVFRGGTILSDLAHGQRSGDLTRAVLDQAADEVQLAYAHGWVTHVLADQWIHPLINLAAGEWRIGGGAEPLTAKDDPLAHVRIEMGLDGYIGRRHAAGPDPRFAHLFDADRLNFLSQAYRHTFGIHLGGSMLDQGSSRLRRLSPLLLAWGRIQAERSPNSAAVSTHVDGVPGSGHAVTSLQFAHGLLKPVPPPAWLIRSVLRRVRQFWGGYFEHAEAEFRSLPNLDLDSGLPAPLAGEAMPGAEVSTSAEPRNGKSCINPEEPLPRRAA